jgi:hypothetical protein
LPLLRYRSDQVCAREYADADPWLTEHAPLNRLRVFPHPFLQISCNRGTDFRKQGVRAKTALDTELNWKEHNE